MMDNLSVIRSGDIYIVLTMIMICLTSKSYLILLDVRTSYRLS